jgi:hypothetical protein
VDDCGAAPGAIQKATIQTEGVTLQTRTKLVKDVLHRAARAFFSTNAMVKYSYYATSVINSTLLHK